MDIKKYISSLPKKKKQLIFLMPLISSLFILSVIIYMFTLHGTKAMYDWIWIYKAITLILGGFAFLLPFLPLIDKKIAINPRRMSWFKQRSPQLRYPSRAFWALVFIGLIIPISLVSWVQIVSIRDGDKSPQLFILDENGKYGIPQMAVVFWTEEEVKTGISWGYGSQSFRIEENESAHIHAFVLSDLPPNTSSWYRLDYAPFSSKTYNFTTPVVEQNSLRIAISSDFHISAPRSNATASENIIKIIADPDNAFDYFFNLGDIVEYGFSDKNWREASEFFTNLTSQVPTRTIIGNHDAMVYGAKFYEEYYYPPVLPLNTTRGDTPFYNRFDINGIHFLLLDLEWGTSETYFGEQEQWLKNQLAEIDPNDWTVVMSHTFYFAKGSFSEGSPWFDNPQTIEALVPLFEQYDVDMVFSGHIHDMQHLVKNNVSYSIIGGGGGYFDPDPDKESAATSLFFDNQHHGYIDLTFQGDSANLTYYSDLEEQLYSVTIYK